LDFGIGDLQARTTVRTRVDHGGRTLVTLAYASPEQLSGEPVSGRSDIYSFGITIYELLTGRRPFAASNFGSLISKHVRQVPDPPTRYRPDIPSWAEAAVLKALAGIRGRGGKQRPILLRRLQVPPKRVQ
jgi:serine/threonine protein kinase